MDPLFNAKIEIEPVAGDRCAVRVTFRREPGEDDADFRGRVEGYARAMLRGLSAHLHQSAVTGPSPLARLRRWLRGRQ